MDGCLSKEHALTEEERKHVKSYPHPAGPSSSCEVRGLRGEKQYAPRHGSYAKRLFKFVWLCVSSISI